MPARENSAAAHATDAVTMVPPATRALVIGCGSSLAGDDAVGPEAVRRLAGRGLPPGVACLDTGTAGFEVVLAMRDVPRVFVIDACQSGEEPGRIRELSGESLEPPPAAGGVSIHRLRWDQAWALARPLLGSTPPRLTAYLVEGRSFVPGEALSPEVDRAVDRLVDILCDQLANAE